MPSSPRACALLLAAAALAAGQPARGEIFGNTFRSVELGVELTVPRGWELSDQRSYPGIIARAFEHTGGARLSLAVQELRPGETARAYVERNATSLRRLHYRVAGMSTNAEGAILLDGATADTKRALRQAYVVRNGFAYILTLASAPDAMRFYGRAFDDTLRSMTLAPEAPAPAPASAPASQPAATTENPTP
jgi:hypothetical protein